MLQKGFEETIGNKTDTMLYNAIQYRIHGMDERQRISKRIASYN